MTKDGEGCLVTFSAMNWAQQPKAHTELYGVHRWVYGVKFNQTTQTTHGLG